MEISLLSSFVVRRLLEADAGIVLALTRTNPLFYEYCPPVATEDSIIQDMRALPPKKTHDDKYFLGFFKGDALVAVMDLILRYPNDETAFIGFFMVDKAYHGGTGSRIIGECFAYLKELGFKYIRLGRAKGNPQSKAFWKKQGFTETGVQVEQNEYTIVVMQKPLS